jgi:hypothetical protein
LMPRAFISERRVRATVVRNHHGRVVSDN